MNKEGPNILFIFIIITAFEIKELQVLCQHFGGMLQHAEIDCERVELEWVLLKSHLYNKSVVNISFIKRFSSCIDLQYLCSRAIF